MDKNHSDPSRGTSSPGNGNGSSRFVPNTVALIIQTVFATLITLLQIKILANFLPQETFGLFASLRGFSLLLATLAANGIPLLLVRFIPVHEANGEKQKAYRLAVCCVLAATALLVVISVITQALGSWTWRFARVGPLGFELFFWFYATTLGVMLKMILYGGLNGLRRLTVQVVIETISLFATLVAIVVFRHELTLLLLFKILGIVHLAAVAAGMFAFFASLRGQTGGAMLPGGSSSGGSKPAVPYMSYYGGAVGLSLVALAFTDVDRYLLAQIISLELLALFHVGARISRLANRVLGVANLAFQPEVTRLDTEGRNASVVRPTWIFLKFNTAVAMLLTVAISVFAREIIGVVSSGRYLDAAPLLIILAASLPLTTMTAPITTVMKARDQVRAALLCDLSWALVYVVLIFVLSPSIGLIGVGCAQLLACLAQLSLTVRLSRLRVDPRLIARLVLKLVTAAVAAFTPSVLFDIFFKGDLIASIAVKVVLFAAGYFVFRWLLGVFGVFDGDEKSTLNDLLERRNMGIVGRFIGTR